MVLRKASQCGVVLGFLVAGVEACSEGGLESGSGRVTGAIDTPTFNELNETAGKLVLYEAQVRSANACDPWVGSQAQRDACKVKPAPKVTYRVEGETCAIQSKLNRIRLGTLEDMGQDTADYRQGITLRYIQEKVGANAVWLMPVFPNNDQWEVPDACDNLGSPYAVRDYFHVSGMLSQACIAEGKDERSEVPCWGTASLDALIAQAHARGIKVFLDVAFNHFGHHYLMYDYANFTSERERLARGESLENLWNFQATREDALVHPTLIDSVEALNSHVANREDRRADLAALQAKCPTLSGDALVRGYNMWRVAFDKERQQFSCDGNDSLEASVPGFYLGEDAVNPATTLTDEFASYWKDVKFLFHREDNTTHRTTFVRNREYIFRIMNYWVSRGVDGFRLDHTTDEKSGLGPHEWKYLTSKVNYYAWLRGQARPIYLAEEFHDQMGMNKVVDIMTEGYVGDMNGRFGVVKDTSRVEWILANTHRFQGHAFVMAALETHDEQRLVSGTGFTPWTGLGFWGLGATIRSTPMILMGQEFGEPWGLGFRRSDYLRARFVGSPNEFAEGPELVEAYRAFNRARMDPANRALQSPRYEYLRPKPGMGPAATASLAGTLAPTGTSPLVATAAATTTAGGADPDVFAQVKWTDDWNVVFTFHNLWEKAVKQTFAVGDALGNKLGIAPQRWYRLVNVLPKYDVLPCRPGSDLRNGIEVEMDEKTRARWYRLELCGP